MNKKIMALTICLLAVNCSRPKGETSKITIEIPNQSSQKVDGLITTGIDEEIATPTSLSSFNCMVILAGAEDLNANSCGRLDATTNTFDGTKDIKFGPWSGMQWLGNSSGSKTIEMEVPTGSNRIFYAVGFHTDQENCEKITRTYDKTKASKPYFLGKSNSVKLETGNDDPVKITLAFNSNEWLDTCRGPIFNQDKDSDAPPEKLVISKASFPAGTTVDGQCELFEYRLLDKFNQPAKAQSNVTFRMHQDSITSPAQAVYTTYDSCTPGTGVITDITIEKGATSTQRWTKIDRGNSAAYTTTLSLVTTGTNITPASSSFYSVTNVNYKTFKITGPSRVLPNTCYDYFAAPKTFEDADPMANYDVTSEFSAVIPTGATFYPNGCEGTASTIKVDNFDGGSATFGIKFPQGTIGAEQTFTLLDDISDLNLQDAPFKIQNGSGSTDPRGLNVLDRSQLLVRGECRGPYFLTLLNEQDTVIRSRENHTIEIDADSGVSVYTAQDCSGTAKTSLQIANATTVTKFYVKTESSLASTVKLREIEFERTGSGSNFKREIYFGVRP